MVRMSHADNCRGFTDLSGIMKTLIALLAEFRDCRDERRLADCVLSRSNAHLGCIVSETIEELRPVLVLDVATGAEGRLTRGTPRSFVFGRATRGRGSRHAWR